MKAGLSLIELMIGLFIASLIAVGLYNTFFLTTRIMETADTRIDLSRTIAIIYNQFEKDLSGIVLPAKEQRSKEESAGEKTKLSVEQFFNLTVKNEKVESFSFLTHNPLVAFQAGQLVQKRRFVRVMYRLVPDDQPDSFKLLRQESPNLDLKEFDLKENKVHAYQVVRNIKSMTIQWPLKNEKDAEKPLYQFIFITLDLWNNNLHQRSTPVTMKYIMPSFVDLARQLEQMKKEQEKKAAAAKAEAQANEKKTEAAKPSEPQNKPKVREGVGKSVQAKESTLNHISDMLHTIIVKIPEGTS